MGVIYEILNLPIPQRKKFVEQIVHQEADEKLKFHKTESQKIKLSK